MSVNVYGFEKTAVPLYVSGKKRNFHVNLFYYKKHFYPVRNLSALIKVNFFFKIDIDILSVNFV